MTMHLIAHSTVSISQLLEPHLHVPIKVLIAAIMIGRINKARLENDRSGPLQKKKKTRWSDYALLATPVCRLYESDGHRSFTGLLRMTNSSGIDQSETLSQIQSL
jgi:hypothetical protein